MWICLTCGIDEVEEEGLLERLVGGHGALHVYLYIHINEYIYINIYIYIYIYIYI